MKGQIILIEGMDYTGKTTLSHRLVELINSTTWTRPDGSTYKREAVYAHSPMEDKLSTTLYDAIRQQSPEENVKKALMLSLNILAINQMNQLKDEGKVVIGDRSILSMLVYQGVRMDDFERLVDIFDIPALDIDKVFILYANDEAIIQRYGQRPRRDVLDEYFMKNMRTIRRRYQKFGDLFYKGVNTFWMDTSDTTIDQSAESILHNHVT